MSQPPGAIKRTLRRQMRQRLAALPPERRRLAESAVVERVLSLEALTRRRQVLSCLSFGSEIDTRRLIERLLAAGHEIYVPRADLETGELSIHRYPCDLERLPFGLEQPVAGTAALDEREIDDSLDLALIVGLAFDPRGFRLGYGGGYFDRFFAAHDVPAVGLGFETQILDALPVEPHDRPMDAVVTEHRLVRPPG